MPEPNPNPDVPPVLRETAAHEMLDRLNFFHGLCFDGMNGPYKSSRQVARVRPNLANYMRASHDISTEEYCPKNEADARNIHHGWPALSALPTRLLGTINQGTKAPSGGNWVSRRLVAHRYTVSLLAGDLEPHEEFVKKVEEALELPTPEAQILCLREICQAWGEFVPLEAVIGVSMAATGALASNEDLTGSSATIRSPDRSPGFMQMIDRNLDITNNNFEKRFESRIRGGYPELLLKCGFDEWLINALNVDNSSTWEVVKVNRAASVACLLPKELQEKIDRIRPGIEHGHGTGHGTETGTGELHHSILVGKPDPLSFDGASQGAKHIEHIKVWSNTTTIQDLSIRYVDGTESGPYGHGKDKTPNGTFAVGKGEFITQCFIWATTTDIVSIQFAKNTGRTSSIFGSKTGTWNPYVLTGGGNALLGMSGAYTNSSIVRLQCVWRSDVAEVKHRLIEVSHTKDAGKQAGTIFNDHEYLGDPSTARIKQIQWFGTPSNHLHCFSVTYTSALGDKAAPSPNPIPNYTSNTSLLLASDEYITRVTLKQDGHGISHLQLDTNKGNTKKAGRQDLDGELYTIEPPKQGMALYYIMGRSDGTYMHAISWVWGMPPQ